MPNPDTNNINGSATKNSMAIAATAFLACLNTLFWHFWWINGKSVHGGNTKLNVDVNKSNLPLVNVLNSSQRLELRVNKSAKVSKK